MTQAQLPFDQLTPDVQAGNRWAAGAEGEAFPVKDNQVWRVGDKHVLVCSDLMSSQLLDQWVNRHPPTLLYCDPPWGQGLVNSFRTKAGLGKADYRWEQLYRRIATFGHARGIPVWLEGSAKEHRDGPVIPRTMAHPQTSQFDDYFPILYSNKSPAGLYYAADKPMPASLHTGTLAGQHDRKTPGIVMAGYGANGCVLDPSVGLGGTPVNAEKVGWSSLSNEMNPNRMSAALFRLGKLTKITPERIA